MNVESEPMMKWCGDGKNEKMEKIHLGNEILASALIKKINKWPPFLKYASYRKKLNYA